MKIASITITSARSEIIGDALRSAGWVDYFIIVDLGMDLDTAQVVNDICGQRAIYCKADEADGTAAWRNKGLLVAEREGCDYAVMLDTDERLLFDRSVFENLDPEIACYSVRHASQRYSKERIFRIPVNGSFKHHIHEAWTGDKVGLLHGVYFDELPKPEDRLDSDRASMIAGLERQMTEDPDNFRWRFYLGLCHRAEGDWKKAIDIISEGLIETDAPDDTRAFACFILADCYARDGNDLMAPVEALNGLEAHPGVAENHFFLACYFLARGDYSKAFCWANSAISQGLFAQSGYAINRLGQMEPYALWEGPFVVKKRAMVRMGLDTSDIDELIRVASKRGGNV